MAVIVVPVAFVSDHIETLVELDIENRHLAQSSGVPGYFRTRAPNDDPGFIAALAGIVKRAQTPGLCRAGSRCQGHKLCPWTKK
jgi:ferrochelatase